jgi:hypothetical protein
MILRLESGAVTLRSISLVSNRRSSSSMLSVGKLLELLPLITRVEGTEGYGIFIPGARRMRIRCSLGRAVMGALAPGYPHSCVGVDF